jgi:hypothetical protein
MRNPWSTFLVFLILAVVVVVTASIQDGFRVDFLNDIRGNTVEEPAPGQ